MERPIEEEEMKRANAGDVGLVDDSSIGISRTEYYMSPSPPHDLLVLRGSVANMPAQTTVGIHI